MPKEKNADDLAAIMSDQLDALTKDGANDDTIKLADSVANMIGKSLKLAALRLAYGEHKRQGGEIIQTLEAAGK